MYATKSFALYCHCDVMMTFETLPVSDINAIKANCAVKCGDT